MIWPNHTPPSAPANPRAGPSTPMRTSNQNGAIFVELVFRLPPKPKHGRRVQETHAAALYSLMSSSRTSRRRRQRALGKLTPIEFEAVHEVTHAAEHVQPASQLTWGQSRAL